VPDKLVEKRIEGVVEFFTIGDREEVQCARCGSSISFEDCPECGGDGWVESPDEDSWAWMEDELERCGVCAGAGGWWVCLSSEDYCRSNPMPGRESVRFNTA
jgi:DnaJ-class molecular chaperone